MSKEKIGVLIEAHYDETEFNRFNEFFPSHGYEVEYLSNLWGQPLLSFKGNDLNSEVRVNKCVTQARPAEYKGIILIGGYAMDRLRYEEHARAGQPNAAPAVQFLRQCVKAMGEDALKIGTICHSLWLFCADRDLLQGRRVTCAHNIICDVVNAGGKVMYEGSQTRDVVIDDGLISAKHPGVVDEFLNVFLKALNQ
jgi:putative intracellular protease/amidase